MKKKSVVTFRTSERDSQYLKEISRLVDIKKTECCRLALKMFIEKYRQNPDLLFEDYTELLKKDREDEIQDKMYKRGSLGDDIPDPDRDIFD